MQLPVFKLLVAVHRPGPKRPLGGVIRKADAEACLGALLARGAAWHVAIFRHHAPCPRCLRGFEHEVNQERVRIPCAGHIKQEEGLVQVGVRKHTLAAASAVVSTVLTGVIQVGHQSVNPLGVLLVVFPVLQHAAFGGSGQAQGEVKLHTKGGGCVLCFGGFADAKVLVSEHLVVTCVRRSLHVVLMVQVVEFKL